MSGQVVHHLAAQIRQVQGSYHRLVLLVGPSGSGKTAILRDTARRSDGLLLNLNLELSDQLLELTEHQRARRLPRVLEDILGRDRSTVFLDHIEMLFDPEFQQDPLSLLKGLSRHRTVVAAWAGAVDAVYLTYGIPGHREFRRYPRSGLALVGMAETG